MRVYAESPEARVVSKNRARALMFFVMAVLASVAGMLLFVQYIDRIKSAFAGQAAETAPVVVAAIDLPIATRIEEKHIEVVHWPKSHVPDGTFNNTKSVLGRTLRQAMVKGEVILKQRLADEKDGAGMAALLSEGQRAMSVKVDAVVGVAGFVKPGDMVDVITVMKPDEESEEILEIEAAKVSKIILQNIKVLAVGEHLETGGRNAVKVKVVTLAVTPEQSEKLALASLHGKIQLTMRSPIDLEKSSTVGVTPLMLLMPDEGAKLPEIRVAETEDDTESVEPVSKKKRKKKSKEKEKEVEAPPKPEAPVVEILRGGRVEERKLRPSEEE